MDTVSIRAVEPSEMPLLDELVLRSLSVWGYETANLERGRGSISDVPGGFNRTVMVADRRGVIVGFYALDIKRDFAEVALLFVDSAEIGGGVGRRLWAHLLGIASSSAVKHLEVAAEPGAEGFYRRMGMARQREMDHGGRRLIGMTLTLG